MATLIKCKYCGKELEISEALTHQIKEQALAGQREKHEKELMDVQKKAFDEAREKTREQFEQTIKQLTESIADEKERRGKLEDQISQLLKDLRKVRAESEEKELVMQKKLLEEEEKIRTDARRKIIEEYDLKDREKDKKLTDALSQIEELKKKIQQGSQQTQGEVLELMLEQMLRKEFPNDMVSEVKKGQRGADVIQSVIDKKGRDCGIILWETKNAAWSDGWIKKLREDQREAKASLAVLVSVHLPSGVDTYTFRDGVWITSTRLIVPLAVALRFDLIHIFNEKSNHIGKNEKMEILYQYLTGTEFRHRIEAIVEAFTNLHDDIEREKRWFSLKWARQEKELRKIVDNTHGMYGELQAVTGRGLEGIKELELETAENGEQIDIVSVNTT